MSHYRIFLDATNLMGPWGAETDDVYMIAGFAIENEAAFNLTKQVRSYKQNIIGNHDIPVKWNIKDVYKNLNDVGMEDLKKHLTQNSNQIRSAMIDSLQQSSATIFCSLIYAYSCDREAILSNRQGLITYALANLLQRIGLWAKTINNSTFRLTLDWPENSKRKPFTQEYLNCWLPNGSSVPRNFCGPLCNLGFDPGVDFGVTPMDPMLQLCDLTVGSFKTLFNYALNDNAHDFGLDQCAKLIPQLYTKTDGTIIGSGIVISPKSEIFSTKIFNALQSVQSRA